MTRFFAAGAALLLAACAGTPETDVAEPVEAGAAIEAQPALVACEPAANMAVEGRASPYDSAMVVLGGEQAKVCYGRPSARGRTIFGGLVAYDQLWRTGANEPTILHLPFAARIGDLRVEPGSYSIYTVPGREQWTVIVNRSTSQWGHESRYTAEVEAQEVGRFQVPAERTDTPVETFTIRFDPEAGDPAADMVLEWENTRIRVPVERV